MSARSRSNLAPAPANARPGRRNVKKAWALAVSGAVAAAVTAGCTTLPQLPGGGASSAPVATDPAAPAGVAAPHHTPDDFSHTLPNPNAQAPSPDAGQQPHGTVAPRIATQFIYRADLPQEKSWVAWWRAPLSTWDTDVQPAVR